MTKKYYEILEISENATQEEIKKAYRKLAMKWHPDKWSNSDLSDRENANKKMQEVNQAFEVLGDEENKRRYDLGQTDFFATDDFDLKEWIRRENERINEEIGEIDDKLEKIKKLLKELAREEIAGNIRSEMLLNGVSRKHLDSNLWNPYSSIEEKVWNIEIGDDENDREGIDKRKLNEFKEKMIKVIREKKTQLVAEKMAKASSDLERAKIKSIGAIEKELQNKGLKIEDLEVEYHNYEIEINNLTKIWKIRSWEDKVIEAIRRKSQGSLEGFEPKKADFDWQARPEKVEPIQTSSGQEPRITDKKEPLKQITDKKEPLKDKYDNWTKEDLIRKIEELEAEIKELKSEKEKVEKNELPEFQIILDKKEMKLKESKERLLQITGSGEKKLEPRQKNELSVGLVAGGIGIFIVLGLLLILIISKSKKEK